MLSAVQTETAGSQYLTLDFVLPLQSHHLTVLCYQIFENY